MLRAKSIDPINELVSTVNNLGKDQMDIINENNEPRNANKELKEKTIEVETKIAEMDTRFEELTRKQNRCEKSTLTRNEVKAFIKDATAKHRRTNHHPPTNMEQECQFTSRQTRVTTREAPILDSNM